MRAVDFQYMGDLAILAERLNSLMGYDTHLYLEITRHPVVADEGVIGYFEWSEELEGVVFRPEKI